MPIPEHEKHFKAIWHRAKNVVSPAELTPELVQSWAQERGLYVACVERKNVGLFVTTPAIVLTANDQEACFPLVEAGGDPEWSKRLQAAEAEAALWAKVEWFTPFWMPVSGAKKILQDAKTRTQKQAIDMFDYHTSTLYTIPFQAVCIAQIVPQSRSLKDFYPLAREAFLAFYSGYRASSISALIPVIEGGLVRIGDKLGSSVPISTKVDAIIDGAIKTACRLHYGKMWVPDEFMSKQYLFPNDERVFAFETFRRWLHQSFFQKTGEYNGLTWLNRHAFAHGMRADWQQSSNFGRLVVALATLALVESWYDDTHSVSLFFPDMNADSKLLWQQAIFQAQAQSVLKKVEVERYHKHGRLVPEMPTDDGALLRKAILDEDCIKDVVRPLRNAGWNVSINEKESSDLYVTIRAQAGEQILNVVLLYSCATGHDVYQRLDQSSQVILYRGAPYHQESFAAGIKAHVGPAAGWLPPTPLHLSPRRRRWHLLHTALSTLRTIKNSPITIQRKE